MRRLAPATALLLLLALGACGYFNSYYNAQRRFAEAERAQRRGETGAAASGYRDAVEKAAVSYRGHPTGRWADDALFLIGRARFALGEYAAARAALGHALQQSDDRELRTGAAIYLGASLIGLGFPDSARAPLESALAQAEGNSEQAIFGRLWLGRARLALGDARGWEDLERAAAGTGVVALDAALDLAAQGVTHGDSARALRALHTLFSMRQAESRADSTFRLLDRAVATWGPRLLLSAIPAAGVSEWSADARARAGLARARLLAAAGDTAGAVSAAQAAAEQTTGTWSGEAREAASVWLLARAGSAEELSRVRALLLPAVAHSGALGQIRRLRTLEVLLDLGQGGQNAALFAAAEFARDTLHSPELARGLFLRYADAARGSVWEPKALLAALPLSAGAGRDSLLARIRTHADNPYVAATASRADPAAFAAAEERLGLEVGILRRDAATIALQGDVRVGRAVAILDSLRNLALSDSVRLRCGFYLDSLALKGIRADSVRGACLRGDSALVTRFLAIDTVLLRDTTAARRARKQLRGDTLPQR